MAANARRPLNRRSIGSFKTVDAAEGSGVQSRACRACWDNSRVMSDLKELFKDPFELVVPLALLLGTVIAGLILRNVLFRVVRKWAAHTESHLDVLMVESLRGPIVLWSLMLGIHLATQHSEIPRRYLLDVPATLTALWILSLTIAMSHLAGNAVRFYGSRVNGVQSVTSITQKLAQFAVVAV